MKVGRNLLNVVAVKVAKVATGAGTTTVSTDVIDTAGAAGVVFVGTITTPAADNKVGIEQGATVNLADAAPLVGSKACDGDHGTFVIEVHRPTERYVRATIARGTSTAIGEVYAILYGADFAESNSDAAAVVSELLCSPDESSDAFSVFIAS